ncbi:MAG: nucleotidyltransferase family protein [Thermoplasmata archaeon]
MILIILAGGFAKRLMPISEFIPKPLLPVSGRPIIDHILDHVKNLDFEKIIISTNSKFADQFKYYIKTHPSYKNMELIIEPTKSESEKFGAVKGIGYVLDTLNVNSDFMVIAGDNFFDFDLYTSFEKFRSLNESVIGLYDIKELEEAKRFGVVNIDSDGKIINITEKPEEPDSTLISMGVYLFKKEIKKFLEEYVENSENKDTLGTFISWLLKKTELYGIRYEGTWVDIGSIDAYRNLFTYKK